VPALEAWEKVIITGSNGTRFLTGVHGPDYAGDAIPHALKCQYCHLGGADYTFADADEAHAGMIRDPSAFGQSGCVQCHDDADWVNACDACHGAVVDATANSLHTNLWGEKKAIEARCGCTFEGGGFESYFDQKCATCHTTCGQCHVSRPSSVEGGFPKFGGIIYSGHRFNGTPDMTENCTACHGSRIGNDFLGQSAGNLQDLHRSRGFNCSSCHTAEEIHGDGGGTGGVYSHRYEVETMPRCENCHSPLPSNAYHDMHVNGTAADANLQCQVCHSQPYKNCTNCHNLVAESLGEKYDIDPSVVQFKIARNPSPWRQEYDYVVVRHTPVDPGTFSDWGLALPDYLSKPTWQYASPHNVLRWTAQTTPPEGSSSCSISCHGTPATIDGIFLREIDLYGADGVTRLPDYEANIGIVMPTSGR